MKIPFWSFIFGGVALVLVAFGFSAKLGAVVMVTVGIIFLAYALFTTPQPQPVRQEIEPREDAEAIIASLGSHASLNEVANKAYKPKDK